MLHTCLEISPSFSGWDKNRTILKSVPRVPRVSQKSSHHLKLFATFLLMVIYVKIFSLIYLNFAKYGDILTVSLTSDKELRMSVYT